ncbi:MAG: glycosyltransferase [Methanocorpusculum sp.]|uniref:glycosyltransferase n=1 Tax=Methanocorpusculum sp. TaxID=2058474 RepID=UPI0027250DF4|nr:glycosyltransferase [Methanocorpusculum sp.]MDO9523813.1 glycosyltransferase [Methanocorpusculum sp.]
MKILQVTESFKPMWESGGVARVSYEISMELAKQGHLITVYTLNRSQQHGLKDNEFVMAENLSICYFGINKIDYLNRRLGMIPSLKSIRIIRNTINRYDFIHIHDYRSLLTVITAHYARKYNVPYLIQAHGALPKNNKSVIKTLFDAIFGKRLLHDAVAVVALSELENTSYRHLGILPDCIHILPNGIDSNYFPLPAHGEFRRKYGLTDTTKCIIFVGRLHPSKGIDLLIRAFAFTHKVIPDTRLILVGPCENKEYSTRLLSLIEELCICDYVIQTGFVTIEEKKMALMDADVFVTPTYSGFPVTFLEACACQVPIVTTTSGDDLGWIDGDVGFVTEATPQRIAEGVLSVLLDNQLSLIFKNKEMDLIVNRFNWECIVKEYESLYSKLR